MNCRKCGKEIPDGSAFCNHCGAKQSPKKRASRRGNGQGSVYKVDGGKWRAVRIVGWYTENGKLRKKTQSKSGFATKREALAALEEMKAGTSLKGITLREVFDRWMPTMQDHVGAGTFAAYRTAFSHLAMLHNRPFAEITVDDWQAALDACTCKRRTHEDMRSLASQLYKYAIPRNIADRNLASYLKIHAKDGEKRIGLPDDAVQKIAGAVGAVPGAEYVLCQIYTGFRPSELLALTVEKYDREEKTFCGGGKTEAGTDRIVPVAKKIQPIVDRLVRDKIRGTIFCREDGTKMSYGLYRELFFRVLEECGIENPTLEDGRKRYTPHSCRHTFATMIKRVSGADRDKLEIMGHTSVEMLNHYMDTPTEDLRRIVDAL